MSESRSAPKKAVSALKRAWTNKVLAKIGRRVTVRDEVAEPAFQTNAAYAAPGQVGAPPKPEEATRLFAPNSRASQFSQVMGHLQGEKATEAALTIVTPIVKDDRAMIAMAGEIAQRQLDQELKIDGKPRTGEDLATAQGALFRSSNDWARLGVAYVKADEEGKAFLGKLQNETRAKVKSFSGSAELRPSEIRKKLGIEENEFSNDITPGIKVEFDKRAKAVVGLMLDVLDSTMNADMPKSLLVVIGTTVEAARKESVGDDEIRKLVGAFVMLRIVNPALMDVVAKPDVSGWIASPDQSRMMTNITKATQNMANGVEGTQKEPFMKPLMDGLRSREGAMNDWFNQIADDGLRLVETLSSSTAPPDSGSSSTNGQDELAPGEKGKERVF